MLEKVSKLINVKSIVTLVMTIVFAYLSVVQVISEEQFTTIYMIVISFYFGTQYQKNTQA